MKSKIVNEKRHGPQTDKIPNEMIKMFRKDLY